MKSKIKRVMKSLATTCNELKIPYERKDTPDSISICIGNNNNLFHIDIEIEKQNGLYGCWINYIPTSFHYGDEEVWMGNTYSIKKYPMKGNVMNMLWKALVGLPHAGHYEK